MPGEGSVPGATPVTASGGSPVAAPVTVLGLGVMGSALAAAVLGAGHHVTVWNRSPAKAGPLVARGAVGRHPADAAAASPPLVVCLLADDAVREFPTASATRFSTASATRSRGRPWSI
ncbi:NAD(P)-binding domain-containing protein [Streptomyces sp. NPDC019507]|uniref:NAD(P)-binding domain-containing protein n=1 Tax=Streptomyces sp. NPDC019507 TaxID=3154689 RepID=UPI0034101811